MQQLRQILPLTNCSLSHMARYPSAKWIIETSHQKSVECKKQQDIMSSFTNVFIHKLFFFFSICWQSNLSINHDVKINIIFDSSVKKKKKKNWAGFNLKDFRRLKSITSSHISFQGTIWKKERIQLKKHILHKQDNWKPNMRSLNVPWYGFNYQAVCGGFGAVFREENI